MNVEFVKKQTQKQQAAANAQNRDKGASIASFILSIISVHYASSFIGIPFGIIAITLSCVDKKINKSFSEFAIAGLSLGIIGIIASLVRLALVLLYLAVYFFLFVYTIASLDGSGAFI